MIKIDDVIFKHSKNSKELKKIYLGNEKLDFNKSREIMKQQDNEYKKMIFFKNLKREMIKNERN